jgi:beta-lactam-binding protein with PASTA domain
MAEEGVIFQFESKPSERREESGIIVEQEPEAGEELAEGDVVKLVMTEPSVVEEEQKFGIFEAELPRYPIVVRIELLEKTEERELSIFTMQHPGGLITIPYIIGIDSQLVFKVAGEVWGR